MEKTSMILTLQQQVTSLQLSQRLNELGVKQESYFYWYRGEVSRGNQLFGTDVKLTRGEPPVSAFTVTELGEMLPKRLNVKVVNLPSKTDDDKWFFTVPDTNHAEMSDTEADARCLMLIYLIEQKIITI